MKIQLKIPSRAYNNLLDYIQDYEAPRSKSGQIKVRRFIAQLLFDAALESQDCNTAAFYGWVQETTAQTFKLKKYENTR